MTSPGTRGALAAMMVDIRRSTMADSADLQAIARKTDARLTALHARFDSVAVRFDQLAAAIAEQREYLERMLQRLEREISEHSPPAVEPPREAQ
jgi:uncharacterized coiled-coil protein SlyX